jgi:hypothetical protein
VCWEDRSNETRTDRPNASAVMTAMRKLEWGEPRKRDPKKARIPAGPVASGNTPSPRSPSAPRTTPGVNAPTGACEGPLTMAFGNDWFSAGPVFVRVVVFGPEWSVVRPNGPAVLPSRVAGPGNVATHRPAQRANRSTNRAGCERNRWPVGPTQVLVGPSRPAGPGWENGWPLGPQDAGYLSARATTDPGGVSVGRRKSSAATTPGPRPQHDVHPAGGARNRGSTGPSRMRQLPHRDDTPAVF